MMIARRLLFALVLFLGFAPLARAGEPVAYDAAAFAGAQAAGKPILIHVTAPWCSNCAKQKPILSGYYASPEFKDLVVFIVDYDSQKDLLRQFNVRTQSTLIVFHGAVEKGRSTADTNAASLKALLVKSLTA
jgi:thioredoxin 1